MPQPRKMELRLLLLLERRLFTTVPSQSAEICCSCIALKVFFKIVLTARKHDNHSKHEVLNVNPIDKFVEEWYSDIQGLRKESVQYFVPFADIAHLM